jgi:large subunit ribosomal protein L3
MVRGLIGKKLGMTQVFDENGKVVPVTVIRVGPCVVVQKKTEERDGYGAIQLGFVDGKKTHKPTKPMKGHFDKASAAPSKILREFSFTEEDSEEMSVGDQLLVKDVFEAEERVDVVGRTIGRGFQGVMKRHGFSGGNASHGSMFHRGPGSIGQSASPSRVLKGIRGPGHMGDRRRKGQNLRVVRVDGERNILLVQGSVPGSDGNYVQVYKK